MAGGEVIGNLAGSKRRYFLKDHLGSVRTTVDRNGNVVGHDDYYPLGRLWFDEVVFLILFCLF